jgi:hypothetical protein
MLNSDDDALKSTVANIILELIQHGIIYPWPLVPITDEFPEDARGTILQLNAIDLIIKMGTSKSNRARRAAINTLTEFTKYGWCLPGLFYSTEFHCR